MKVTCCARSSAGARAYLLKDSATTDLVQAIHAVVRGEVIFQPRGEQGSAAGLHAKVAAKRCGRFL